MELGFGSLRSELKYRPATKQRPRYAYSASPLDAHQPLTFHPGAHARTLTKHEREVDLELSAAEQVSLTIHSKYYRDRGTLEQQHGTIIFCKHLSTIADLDR